ncbi:YgiQ family radical SAM protein [Sulfuritalea hydrogenivorans]|uniref:Radical SAM protein n=1 Tax=Sulfuritalea hydrogenivorans sk43H TaxID=1223802 RepID=W0SD51_9PROT|nr:YgiQ family radical SAM protein [Sulfuritalea hydrogenivorans]BAO28690.1 radical SAM protein [Sulfuritalea hydrogenivorans sk43H]
MATTTVAAKPLTSYRKYWALRFGPAPFLPMSRAEMDALGWDECDIILVTGDAYIDHPSFGMALVGRLLEAQGFRVGLISQPDWLSSDDFKPLGKPKLFFGITAGNMDSMVNRYTSDRKIRSDDAYTPNAAPDRRPDRAVIVYSQRAREAFPDVPLVIGGIEASLRRIAHYDYWSDKVRRSILPHSKADLLLFGNAERALVELAHRLAKGEKISEIRDLRGTAFMVPHGWLPGPEWAAADSTTVDTPGAVHPHPDPYAMEAAAPRVGAGATAIRIVSKAERLAKTKEARAHTAIRLPSHEQVRDDPVLYAHASRTFHLESNPGNARALVQAHGEGASRRDLWLNPPPIPLSTEEMDHVFGLPYARAPHPRYGDAKIPAWEMIRFSINIMRGCFGGCTFCSITEHEGRIIQSRSETSILHEIEQIRDKTPGFTGVISDLGGPTANMYRMACRSPAIESSCRRLSCVFPGICENLGTDHAPLISVYRKARALPGIKKILISSGLRYDLAVRSPEYVKELVTHHVGGYLKIAPEHTQEGPLSKMMKPGMSSYERFKQMFDKFSKEAGKEQYLIPYFIAAHPGTTDEDMLELALWLKKNGFRLDQVQTFLPTPLAIATAMWHTEKNPLRKVTADSESVAVVRGGRQRKLQKAFLRYHDPANWPLLREALKAMGRSDLIGPGKRHLIPAWQPAGTATASAPHKPGQSAHVDKRPQKSALAGPRSGIPGRQSPTRRTTPAAPAKPGKAPPARRHPDVPRHPLSRRKGG